MRQSNLSQPQKEKTTFFSANPVMKKVAKIRDRAQVDENSASFIGILIKTAYFLLMTVVGVVAYLFAQQMWFQHQPMIEGLQYRGFEFSISAPQAFTLFILTIVGVISQLIAAFAPSTIPVMGTIYSLTQGAFISCTVFTILGGEHMEYLGLLALIITIIVVATMAVLYTTGIVKVDKKFRMILLTLIFSSMGLSLVLIICAFIPGVNTFVYSIIDNFWISILLSLISLLISVLFLVSEFAVMDDVVTNRYPVKYEWNVAFGLAFAIIWIYVKILEIVIRIAGNNRGR